MIVFKHCGHLALITTLLVQNFELITGSATIKFFGTLLFISIGFKPKFTQFTTTKYIYYSKNDYCGNTHLIASFS
jgi:hypothetical protein